MSARAQAVYFGASGDLFGFAHEPTGASARDVAVVLVPPIGYEIMCSAPSYRALAERLASEGFFVLRFDLHGTGDSGGTDRDPDRVRRWLSDIGAAVAEARARSGKNEVSLVGLRLGATLAIESTKHIGAVASIVLWCPCKSGKAHVREMRALRMMEQKYESGERAAPVVDGAGADEEVVGFVLTGETIAALSKVDPVRQGVLPAPSVLLLSRDDFSPEDQMAAKLVEAGAQVDARSLPGFATMMLAPHNSRIATEMVSQITEWLMTKHPATEPRSDASATSQQPLFESPDVRETALRFGADQRLFGILSEPREGANRKRTAVVLTNTGAHHRTGAHRVYVPMAREWAREGFVTLRFDLIGLGDSDHREGGVRLYSLDSLDDVRDAVAEARKIAGVEQVVVIGLCAGAYVAFHGALAHPGIDGVVMINPQTLAFRDGDSLDVKASTRITQKKSLRHVLTNRATWSRLRRGEIDVARAARRIVTRAVHLVRTRVLGAMGDMATESEASKQILSLVESGTDLFLLFSGGDPGIDWLESSAPTALSRLKNDPRMTFETIEGPDHTFTDLDGQRRLGERLSRYLRERERG